MRKQIKFLVNNADTQALRIARIIYCYGGAIHEALSAIGGYRACDNLRQGVLAGAILPHQRMNFACKKRKVGPLQRTDAIKTLIDFAEL